jgi:hypothetical protein
VNNGNNGVSIINYAPAKNRELSRSLVSLEESIRAAAVANLQEVLDQDNGYSETEREAMITIESLKQVNGLDLAAVLMRGKFLKVIEERNMIANHPGGYSTLQEMANDQGISITELSQTRDLCFTIFPYVEEHLGLPIANLWEGLGKSNFKELIPVLKQIITNDQSGTQSVQNAVNRILDDVAATAQAAGQDLDDGGLRRQAVEQLIEAGVHLNNRELRNRIRPERTPNIQASIIGSNGTRILVASLTEDQWLMLQRKMGERIDALSVDLPIDPRARQEEAARIPELRQLLNFLRGD